MSFDHPVGADGTRMMINNYETFRGNFSNSISFSIIYNTYDLELVQAGAFNQRQNFKRKYFR